MWSFPHLDSDVGRDARRQRVLVDLDASTSTSGYNLNSFLFHFSPSLFPLLHAVTTTIGLR